VNNNESLKGKSKKKVILTKSRQLYRSRNQQHKPKAKKLHILIIKDFAMGRKRKLKTSLAHHLSNHLTTSTVVVATLKNNQIDNRSKSNDNKIDDDNGKNSGKNKYKQRKKHQMCIVGSKQ
jgi:hypothetical protein